MNIGARNNNSKSYDKKQIIRDSNPKKLNEKSIKNMILRQTEESGDWVLNRSNDSDFETNKEDICDKLAKLRNGVRLGNTIQVIEACIEIMETQKHPTASDIVNSPCKQAIYNICGKRAYNYEI